MPAGVGALLAAPWPSAPPTGPPPRSLSGRCSWAPGCRRWCRWMKRRSRARSPASRPGSGDP